MKRFLALIMALTMVFALCACGSGSTAASSSTAASTGTSTETYNIKLGHSDTVDNLLHVSLLNFKAYVEEKSEGRLKVDVYASEQLGSNAEMAEMVEMGSLDAMMLPQGQEANYAPKLNIPTPPPSRRPLRSSTPTSTPRTTGQRIWLPVFRPR